MLKLNFPVKRIYAVLLVLLPMANLYSQGRNHTIVYTASTVESLDFKYDSSSKRVNDFNKRVNRVMMETTIEFELLINDQIALYAVKDALDENNARLKIARIIYGAKDKFYMDKRAKVYINQIDAYGDLFLLPIKEVEWKLTKESKKIGDYSCFKATTNYAMNNDAGTFDKKVTAWYTPDINANFGPRGYHGLPGLILELQDDKYLFTATELHLNQKKAAKIVKPTKGRKMSIEEFENLGKTITPGRQ